MSDFGGQMRMTFAGIPLVLRGAFKLDPSMLKSSVKTNQDGSLGRVFTPDAYGAELTLEDTLPAGVTWEGLIRAPATTIVLVEDQLGVIHTFSQAVFEADMSVNREDGEVSGLKIRAPSYIMTKA